MSLSERIGRLDAWQNLLTGLGTWRDKLTSHRQVPSAPLTDTTLEALYTDDDICAKIVDKLPSDAMRGGFTIKIKADATEDALTISRALDEAMKDLQAPQALRQAWIWGRLYGFGAVLVGADDGQDVDQPLELERVRTCTFLTVLRRTQLVAQSWYEDIRSPQFGRPETYRVILPPQATRAATSSSSSNGARRLGTLRSRYGEIVVHESRLLIFRGVTTARYPVLSGEYWDDSVLQRVHESVRQTSSAWMSVAHLMTDASQGVLKLKNLMQLLSTGGEGQLRKRMQIVDMARSVARMLLIDADQESFERVTTSFTGIPELLDRFMMRDASSASMPVTILYGRSPAGMNATGESDTRAWYDQVASQRMEQLVPPIEKLTTILMACDDGPTQGTVIDGWSVEFPPLWQPTKAERATGFKTEADALVALVRENVILPEEAALTLARSGELAELDIATREAALRYELERMRQPPEPPEPEPEPEPTSRPVDQPPKQPGEPAPQAA